MITLVSPKKRSAGKAIGFLLLSTVLLGGCEEQSVDIEPAIRGLKAFKVSESSSAEARRYPSVVQPAQETKLAFEIAGKLKDITLEVGQRVAEGQVLAELDPVSLELKTQSAEASLDEATAAFENARSDFDRKSQLLEKQYVTQSQFDDAKNVLNSSEARLSKAQKELSLARQDSSKTQLLAPFTGVVSSIEAEDFAQISPGSPVIGLYSEGAYEVSFSVPGVIINSISVGDSAKITFSDLPGKVQSGKVKELGTRATKVSAFPVVVALDETPEGLRAGIASEVELSIALVDKGEGFLIPLSCFIFADEDTQLRRNHRDIGTAHVYVYDPETSTVNKQTVEFLGIRGNMAIVAAGVNEGDIVAAAGISYLTDGQQVKLLDTSLLTTEG